jgi:glycosyltransferase involved in cell wall biosynthesis
LKILIAHFGTNWVNMPGGVEKVTCELANALINAGHEVTILYRDNKEGSPYFPLSHKARQINILFENGRQVISENLPTSLRIMREVTRLFSQSRAQGINARFKGKQYGSAIKRILHENTFDVVISCSIPSAKYLIDDGECQLPVIEMLHAQPQVQFPDLSQLEKNALLESQLSHFKKTSKSP